MAITRALDALLLPERCVLCRRRAFVDVWCAACAAMIVPANGRCYRCGGSPQHGHACWPPGAPVDSTTIALIDSGPLRRTLRTAARYGVTASWQAFGVALARKYLLRDGAPTVVCAIPLPLAQQRKQPHDQRTLLAATFAHTLSLPLGPALSRRVRSRQIMRSAVVPTRIDCHVVLVTDVLHTGSSVWAAAEQFREAGSKRVDVVAVTRRGEQPLGPPLG